MSQLALDVLPKPPRTQPLWCVYCWRVFVPALHFRVSVCPGCGADLEETP